MSKKDFSKVNIDTGNRLKKARESKHLTQSEVAAEIGLTLPAYKKLESGENEIITIRLRFLKELGISSDYLLYGDKPSVDSIMFDINSCSNNEKLEILRRLVMDIAQRNSGNIPKDELAEMIAAVFNKDKT